MMTTMDQAGRVVIPKALRDEMGLTPGEIEITVSGAGLRIEARTATLVEHDGRLFLPADGAAVTADDVRELRLGNQR